VLPYDLFLAVLLFSGQPPVEQESLDASSPSSDASGNSDAAGSEGEGPAPAEDDAGPDEPEPEGDAGSDEQADDAMLDAFAAPLEDDPPEPGDGEGEGEGGVEASGVEGETAGEVDSEATAVSSDSLAPSGDEDDLSDIFGDPDAVEELPDVEEVAPVETVPDGKALDGKLEFKFRVLSSVYIDIDNLYEGKRWNPDQPSLGEAVERPSAFKVGQAIPRGTISRNENRLEFTLAYQPNDHVRVVGNLEGVFLGASQVSTLDDIATRQLLTPFHFESDAAYVALLDILPGLDLTVGRQIVVWGTADKFNPTNNINSDDLEDRPLFTEPIANQMVKLDFAPWGDKLSFQGIYVPIFYPALLPPSASYALADPQTPVNFANQSERDKLAFLQNFITANERFNPRVTTQVEAPPLNITNGQAAFKVASTIGPVDLSASYYYGFFDIPVPYETSSNQLASFMEDPVDGYWFQSDVTLVYPRMHVAGLDFATQLPFLGDMGLWGEAALIIPTQEYAFNVELPLNLDITPGDGVMNPVAQFSGPIVKKQPFVKATVGADYTVAKRKGVPLRGSPAWYLNVQYLRGFIDDFGASNLGDYIVGGQEFIMFGRNFVFRFWAVVDLPRGSEDKASLVLAPNFIIKPPWGFATFEVGGFAFLGRNDTKFGQSAVGSSIAYAKIIGEF